METPTVKAATTVESTEAGLPTEGIRSRHPALPESAESAGARITGTRVTRSTVPRIAAEIRRIAAEIRCVTEVPPVIEIHSVGAEITSINDCSAMRDIGVVGEEHPAATVPIVAP